MDEQWSDLDRLMVSTIDVERRRAARWLWTSVLLFVVDVTYAAVVVPGADPGQLLPGTTLASALAFAARQFLAHRAAERSATCNRQQVRVFAVAVETTGVEAAQALAEVLTFGGLRDGN